MKIEVRNVKEVKSMSEETMCFTATVVIDGAVVGTVRNDGRGGAHMYSPPAIADRLEEHAKTLPPMILDGHPVPHNADSALNEVVLDFLTRRDLRRSFTHKVMWETTDGRVFETRRLPAGTDVRAMAERYATRPGVRTVLNLIPEDEAVAIVMRSPSSCGARADRTRAGA
jgi:hypothetical protein